MPRCSETSSASRIAIFPTTLYRGGLRLKRMSMGPSIKSVCKLYPVRFTGKCKCEASSYIEEIGTKG